MRVRSPLEQWVFTGPLVPAPSAGDLAVIPREERHNHEWGRYWQPSPLDSDANTGNTPALPPLSDQPRQNQDLTAGTSTQGSQSNN
jgi:hypothetical protein